MSVYSALAYCENIIYNINIK